MIFNWLYRRRIRKMFAPLMPPHAIEECLPPRLPERKAFRGWLEITFPNLFKPDMDRNTLVALRNKMAPAVKEAEELLRNRKSDVER
jgi:hypothetical protein